MSNFERVPNRKGTRSVKWDLVESIYGSEDVIPMWVADMDFEIPQPVTDALVERAQHGIFGYTFTDPSYTKSVTNWLENQHQWHVSVSSILFSPGVVTSLHMAIQAFTEPSDKVLIQTPVYPPFYKVIEAHDRTLVTNPLKYENHQYQIDFDDFEKKLQQGVKVFILCNPHNPVGRVWTKQELEKMAQLCLQYDVLLLSDEIHADLIYSGHKHIPIASLSDEINQKTITAMSPTKTFNLAGLQASFVVVADKEKRDKLKQFFEKQGINMLNTMGNTALEAAYTQGKAWLNELLDVLESNRNLVIDTFKNRDEITIIEPEGTYLVWMDCRNMNMPHQDLKNFMQEKAKVGLNDGVSFGDQGDGFMRMNIACSQATLEKGLNQIIHALDQR
ncbi:MalY/PatB family protein [Aquibacillus sediminis]|uniref:MalY/PatB family protein n=1 Tax=Aquibacillus sediminis TaxID=2574734 RepID=UPI001108C43F|nr:MalY/PatB family protein [Aquibacillus sediminis]